MFESIITYLGIDTLLPLVEKKLLSEAASLGEPALERVISLPESVLDAVCSKTGANPDRAKELRDIAAKAEADFMVYLATGTDPSAAPTA